MKVSEKLFNAKVACSSIVTGISLYTIFKKKNYYNLYQKKVDHTVEYRSVY